MTADPSSQGTAVRAAGLRPLGRLLTALRHLALPPVCLFCRQRLEAAPGAAVCHACSQELGEIGEPRCTGCGGDLDTTLQLCHECITSGFDRPWRGAVSVFRFDHLVREGIHRFKYRNHPEFAPWFARRMVEAWRRHGTVPIDLVVPVPLHWRREWHRGYNQAALLAGEIARQLRLPQHQPLFRQRSTKQQAKLHFQERQRNMKGVFGLRSHAGIQHKRLLLVDDVLTTGATLAAASETLLAGGAQEIHILTTARG